MEYDQNDQGGDLNKGEGIGQVKEGGGTVAIGLDDKTRNFLSTCLDDPNFAAVLSDLPNSIDRFSGGEIRRNLCDRLVDEFSDFKLEAVPDLDKAIEGSVLEHTIQVEMLKVAVALAERKEGGIPSEWDKYRRNVRYAIDGVKEVLPVYDGIKKGKWQKAALASLTRAVSFHQMDEDIEDVIGRPVHIGEKRARTNFEKAILFARKGTDNNAGEQIPPVKLADNTYR